MRIRGEEGRASIHNSWYDCAANNQASRAGSRDA